MHEILFIVIIVILIADYLLERLLDYLDSRLYSVDLPEELTGIYDAEKYGKSQEYERVKTRFGTLTETFSLILILAMLLFGGFAFVDGLVNAVTGNPILTGLMFFGILMLGSDLLSTFFTAYFVFNIEERFGFNQTTIRTFITDKLKGWLLAVILGGGLLALVIWIYTLTGPWFWLIAWGVMTVFSVFMSMFYSQLIVPLFNKQKPLESGELRDAIEEYCRKTGFRLDNVFVIDGSKRSKKANAYFTGLGSKKRIVLYDTLIKDHATEELVAILAHETGHYKKKHTLWGMIVSIIMTGIMLYVFSLFIDSPELSATLGAGKPSFHMGLIAFGILYSPLSLVLGVIMNIVSRENEYAADRYAGQTYSATALQTALAKLSVNNLSNLRPHPASVIFHYSHPPLLKRLRALESLNGLEKKETNIL
jgi:STE24 endopeptidase